MLVSYPDVLSPGGGTRQWVGGTRQWWAARGRHPLSQLRCVPVTRRVGTSEAGAAEGAAESRLRS